MDAPVYGPMMRQPCPGIKCTDRLAIGWSDDHSGEGWGQDGDDDSRRTWKKAGNLGRRRALDWARGLDGSWAWVRPEMVTRMTLGTAAPPHCRVESPDSGGCAALRRWSPRLLGLRMISPHASSPCTFGSCTCNNSCIIHTILQSLPRVCRY